MQRFCNCWRVWNLLLMVLRFNESLMLAQSIVSLCARLLRPSSNIGSFLQCILYSLCVTDNARDDPFPLTPNFHAERSSPLTAGDLNISHCTILNTFKIHTRRIWLFAVRHKALNPLSIMHSTLRMVQLKAWTLFCTSTKLKTSLTYSLSHRHLLCRGRKHTQALVLRWAITLLRPGNVTLRVALRRAQKTIPTTHLRCVKSTYISIVGWRRRAWRRSLTTCWRKKTPLRDSQVSKMGMVSLSSALACPMIRVCEFGKYTLLRKWDGMTITKSLSQLQLRYHQEHEMVDAAASIHWASHLRPSALLYQRHANQAPVYRNALCGQVVGDTDKEREPRIRMC